MIGFKFLSYWITVHLIVYDNLKKEKRSKTWEVQAQIWGNKKLN